MANMGDFAKAFESACSGICLVEDMEAMRAPEGFVGDGILGTAFLVRKETDGSALFATAKHVIEETPRDRLELRFSYVLTGGTPTYSKGVMDILDIKKHPTRDVCLVSATPAREKRLVRYFENGKKKESIKDVSADLLRHNTLLLGSEDQWQVGADILMIGYGEGKDFVFIDDILGPGSPKALVPIAKHGIISQIIPADQRPREVFLYDIETAPGFSGSPILSVGTENTSVLGIHTDGMETKDMGYAHAIRFVKDLL